MPVSFKPTPASEGRTNTQPILRACFKRPVHRRSRRKEALISGESTFLKACLSLLTSALTIVKQGLNTHFHFLPSSRRFCVKSDPEGLYCDVDATVSIP